MTESGAAKLTNDTSVKTDEICLPSIEELLATQIPEHPLYCVRPRTIISTCERFISKFAPGHVLYAVKCNADPIVLDAIWHGGVRHFDCASLQEIEKVRRQFPSATIHYLHPIKSKSNILDAYERWGVRTYALDSIEELEKIVQTIFTRTQTTPKDLTLVVRLAIPDFHNKKYSLYPLSGKFGIGDIGRAANVLKLTREKARFLGISFHVGCQCVHPVAYAEALEYTRQVIEEARVHIDIIDVGGGFPVNYPHSIPPPIDDYIETINEGYKRMPSELTNGTELWCEPGRGLVAEGCLLVVRVVCRRPDENVLFVNDGIYGNLRMSGPNANWQFPHRLLRKSSAELVPFRLYGPTCDSVDHMLGPFLLPADTDCDDFIEIGQFGAYNKETSTNFNGFGQTSTIQIR